MTTVTVRMDDELKKSFDEICNDLGMSMTTAVTMLAKKMTREKRLPFDVAIETPNAATRKAIEDAHNGVGVSRPFTSVAELMEDLNADD